MTRGDYHTRRSRHEQELPPEVRMNSRQIFAAVGLALSVEGCSNPDQRSGPVYPPAPPPATPAGTTTGSAHLEVTVLATGINIPSAIGVQITADMVGGLRLYETLTIGQPRLFTVPYGIYVAQAGSNNCALQETDRNGNRWFGVLTAQGTRLTLHLLCS